MGGNKKESYKKTSLGSKAKGPEKPSCSSARKHQSEPMSKSPIASTSAAAANVTPAKTFAHAVATGSNPGQVTAGVEKLTRKHGVRCLMSSTHGIEAYIKAAAEVVGHSAVVAASKMYGKAIIFARTLTAVHTLVQRGITVGGSYVPVEPLEGLGTRVVLSNVPPFLQDHLLYPHLQALGELKSNMSRIPLGCKESRLRHVLSFKRQVQLLLPRGQDTIEGSFGVPFEGVLYKIFYSTEEVRCFLCKNLGHTRQSCPKGQIKTTAPVPAPSASNKTSYPAGTISAGSSKGISPSLKNLKVAVTQPTSTTSKPPPSSLKTSKAAACLTIAAKEKGGKHVKASPRVTVVPITKKCTPVMGTPEGVGVPMIATSVGVGADSGLSSSDAKKKRKFKSNWLVPEEWASVVNDGAPPSKGKKGSKTSAPHVVTLSGPTVGHDQPVSDHALLPPDQVGNNEVNGLHGLEHGSVGFPTESGVQYLPQNHLEDLPLECKETPNETPAEWAVSVPEVLRFGNCNQPQFLVPQGISLQEGENIGLTPIQDPADKTAGKDGEGGVVDTEEGSQTTSTVHAKISLPLSSTDPNVIAIQKAQEVVERAEANHRASKALPVAGELISSVAPVSNTSKCVSSEVEGTPEPLQGLQKSDSDTFPATTCGEILKALVERGDYQSLSQEELMDEGNIEEEVDIGVANPSTPIIPAEELKKFLESTLGVKLEKKMHMALEKWHDLPLVINSVRQYIKVIKEAKNYGTAEYLRIMKFHKKCLSHQTLMKVKALPKTQ
uniref:Transposon TX1 uncharacterized 82 kDa protein n=1 Tax=Xenopus laevis TaxID=8355 RepID=YTX1_XENLA|nr:RecName: Full=Transposon TX1 uncharacterized 82 kDa protein; AltName: Full=ORF 1 [Xenopus laevis]AAA49975.1 ORF1 [Xenopus laevis]